MTGFSVKLRTAWKLGPANIGRVLIYKFALRLGLHPAQRLKRSPAAGVFFPQVTAPALPAVPTSSWTTCATLFGHYSAPIGEEAPDWFVDPLRGRLHPSRSVSWWLIPDFTEDGDIKAIWELSRLDWAVAFAQRARNGDAASLARLNAWLEHWSATNRPFLGPNWKCAQEASIRVLRLATAALILDQDHVAAPPLADLIRTHLQRIKATLSYAIAQDNNHAISEAAALLIGGSWLSGAGHADGADYARLGRRQLERHVARLFAGDGSFSQHSLNYHRLALDTLSLAEIWRRRHALSPFSERLRGRAKAAAAWLVTMIDPVSGDAPNIGANDGANLLPLTDADYRDFRPAAQLATTLFANAPAFTPGSWDQALLWLGVPPSEGEPARPASHLFDDGGYAVLRRGGAMALIRYPRFRFRPAQSDALHLDLWVEGRNLLPDAGTYSYHAGEEWTDYFGGVISHNSIQFDDRDQMPRLSRFLLGDWLASPRVRPIAEEEDAVRFTAAYRDRTGLRHHRALALQPERLMVLDTISGFRRKAVLRWRLSPGQWRVLDGHVTNGEHRLSVTSPVSIKRMEIVQGWESRYYLEKNPLPVLEVEVHQPTVLTSEYRWAV